MNQAAGISAVAIVSVLCCVVLRKQVPEFSIILSVTAGALVLWMVFSSLNTVTSFLSKLTAKTELADYVFDPVLKVAGISIITKTSCEICKDAQESGLASFLEIGGTILALSATIPLAEAVLQTLSDLI